tara:strand:+ start:548 stop:727 length:180 start_codon:yes stop_codon:yes gene_type:complete
MPVIKTKKIPMTTTERQKKYLSKPENMAKHRERLREYYKKVIKPKREAAKREAAKRQKK